MTVSISTAAFRRELNAPASMVTPSDALLMARNPAAPRCEEVRALRGLVASQSHAAEGTEIIALLSPRAGEGRSLLAAELAISLAQSGQPTLLIDADMRRPRQHLLFDARELPGLAEALRSGTAPQLHEVQGVPQLSLLAAGNPPVNPGELLFDGGFPAMMRDWRDHFRFVVIDTPPFMLYPDAMVIANCASHSLALCRARHTPYGEMQEMLRRLALSRAPVLGAVLNHF
jgi:receptor protein-tyrosine kinase